MQLVNKGAQDQLVTGSPSFTHFRSVYKRHTEFAMEHFRLDFRSTNLDLNPTTSKSMRVRVDRNAQLVHDCYLHVSLPDIYSPVAPIAPGRPELAPDAQGIGYEFQWIPNLGYNMINYVAVLINGTEIVRHTGEWMKLYSYLTYTANKRKIIDGMIGNVPELYDPANAKSRRNQYPHAISYGSQIAQPSILARDLVIPLHFWFCEDIGTALPLVALQYSEVEFVVEFASIYELFTIRDTRPTSTSAFSRPTNAPPTFGQRIAPNPADFPMSLFLSPPTISGGTINTSLTSWSLNPYVEANYIFLGDAEVIQLAKSDNSFKIKQVRSVYVPGLYGGGNDIELLLVNLCTRIVWVAQRSDVIANNGVDNYTNQLPNPYEPYRNLGFNTPKPIPEAMTLWYSTGAAIGQNLSATDIVIDGVIVLDGAERFNTKTFDFFKYLENYQHNHGNVSMLPGIYTYSFALDHDSPQPSGQINGSMFNKTILRLTLQDPPFVPATDAVVTPVCILKSTALTVPVVVTANSPGDIPGGFLRPDQVITTVTKGSQVVRPFTYAVSVYVESYNFLRITRGIANVVFSS